MQQLRHLYRFLLTLTLIAAKDLRAQVNTYNNKATANQNFNVRVDTTKINQVFEIADSLSDFEPDSSDLLYNKALAASLRINYQEGIIKALGNLGQNSGNSGNYSKSLAYFRRLLSYIQGIDNRHTDKGAIYVCISNIYTVQGQYDSAAYYTFKALDEVEHYKITSYRQADVIYKDVSDYWDLTGDTKKALYYLQKAEDLLTRYKDTTDLPQILITRSNIYGNGGQWDSALYYCEKGLASSKNANDLLSIRQATLGIGVIYSNKNQPDPQKAIPWILEAIHLCELSKDQQGLIRSRYYLANAYYLLHDYKKAQQLIDSVITQSQAMGLKDNELANAHNILGRIYQQSGNYRQAFSELKIYKQVEDSLFTKAKAIIINRLSIQYQVAEKDKIISERQLQLSKQQNDIKEKNLWIGGISAITLLLGILFLSLFIPIRHLSLELFLLCLWYGKRYCTDGKREY